MKIHDCIQGSAEWLALRCGIPTASRFGDIITPTGKAVTGAARRNYALELIGERMTGKAHPHMVTAAMMRGTELEPKARQWYELRTGRAVSAVGFVSGPGERQLWGSSPDGITTDGGIEIKCPLRTALLSMLANGHPEPDYYLQVQGNMWVCQRYHWDFVLYTDERGLPSVVWTIAADDKVWTALDRELPVFCNEVRELERTIKDHSERGEQ